MPVTILGINLEGTPEEFKKNFKRYVYQLSLDSSRQGKAEEELTLAFADYLSLQHKIDLRQIVLEINKRTSGDDVAPDMPPRSDEENLDYLIKLDAIRKEVVENI